MIFKDAFNGKETTYSIPNIPQLGDYRYAKDLTCGCAEFDKYEDQLKKWRCDGVYDSNIGVLICFTCKSCGEKFCFHLRDNADCYAALGVFDEYITDIRKI